jgi:pimeloyl-ACP methyl ester carboxylesterase
MSQDQPILPVALSGGRREQDGRAGPLSYYVAGFGAPVLLVHSINAAASAYEVGPIFEHLRHKHSVYAVDLPGFGFSDRSDRRYDVSLFVSAVDDMLDVIERDVGATPVDALAISLGAEFLARAAVSSPHRFRSLALVTPTGFNSGADRLRDAPGSTREVPGLHAVLSAPLLAPILYRLLVTRPSIRYFLKQAFGSDDVDQGLLRYCYLTSHQPGARHAPLAFLAGRLFSGDIRDIYERLDRPVWLPHASRGSFKDFTGADWAKRRTNWTVQPFNTGALPHFEQAAAFNEQYERFLQPPHVARQPAEAVW